MTWRTLCVLGGVVLLAGQAAMAQGFTPMFEDDFDSYGTCTTTPPDYCGCSPDNSETGAFMTNWVVAEGPGAITVESDFANCATNSGFRGWDPPFSAQQRKETPYRNIRDLRPIIAGLEPGKNAVNGTDDNPLVMNFYLWLLGAGRQLRTSLFVDLFAYDDLGVPDPAPVTMPVEDPDNPGEFIDVPIRLNFSGSPPSSCTLLNTTPSVPRSAIAFGFFSGNNPDGSGLVPKPPCDNLTKELTAAVLYDGDHWILLKSNFPSAGAQVNPSEKWTEVTLTIKSTTMDLLVTSNDYPAEQTRLNIPRAYTGPFQAIGLGAGVASQYPGYADRLRLSGGEFATLEPGGACCVVTGFATGTCTTETQEDCELLGGEHLGDGTSCSACDYCPTPFGDADLDGDQDQFDFALLQVCTTGTGGGVPTQPPGCVCFDRDNGGEGDGDIDGDDFFEFFKCVSGPEIPFDAQNPPLGCTP